MTTYTCTRCEAEKPMSAFSPRKNRPLGIDSRCRACRSEVGRERRARDAGSARRAEAKWRKANPEKVTAKAKRNYDREQQVAKVRAWRRANPQKHRAVSKRWRDAHPDRCRTWSAAYRARALEAFEEDVSRAVVFRRDGGICGICHAAVEGEFHVDHIVPLSRGGRHSYANVQLAHPRCNMRKYNHSPCEPLS